MNSETAAAQDRSAKRILFVDDEPSIRLTLPPVLKQAGFDVHVAESVGDAIFEINSYAFDALISDLNIGEEGDGFLVTSAMRHIQPHCVTFILTGYPAFETALEAIRGQVDDYLVKPVEVQSLIATLKERLTKEGSNLPLPVRRLSGLLRENSAVLVRSALRPPRRTPRQSSRPDKASKSFKTFVRAMADQIDASSEQIGDSALRLADEYGKSRARNKAATAAALVREFGQLESAVYSLLQRDLTSAEGTVTLVSDLRTFTCGLNVLLNRCLESFENAASRRSQK